MLGFWGCASMWAGGRGIERMLRQLGCAASSPHRHLALPVVPDPARTPFSPLPNQPLLAQQDSGGWRRRGSALLSRHDAWVSGWWWAGCRVWGWGAGQLPTDWDGAGELGGSWCCPAGLRADSWRGPPCPPPASRRACSYLMPSLQPYGGPGWALSCLLPPSAISLFASVLVKHEAVQQASKGATAARLCCCLCTSAGMVCVVWWRKRGGQGSKNPLQACRQPCRAHPACLACCLWRLLLLAGPDMEHPRHAGHRGAQLQVGAGAIQCMVHLHLLGLRWHR